MTYKEDGHEEFSTCLYGKEASVVEENDLEPKVTNGLDLESSIDNDTLQPSQEWLQDVEVDLSLDAGLCVKGERKSDSVRR